MFTVQASSSQVWNVTCYIQKMFSHCRVALNSHHLVDQVGSVNGGVLFSSFVCVIFWLINGAISLKQLLCIPVGDIVCIFSHPFWFTYIVIPPLYIKNLYFFCQMFQVCGFLNISTSLVIVQGMSSLQNTAIQGTLVSKGQLHPVLGPWHYSWSSSQFRENPIDLQSCGGNRSLQKSCKNSSFKKQQNPFHELSSLHLQSSTFYIW